jgi:hypothetical protein
MQEARKRNWKSIPDPRSQIPDPSRQQRRAPARSPVFLLLIILGRKPHGHFDHKNAIIERNE